LIAHRRDPASIALARLRPVRFKKPRLYAIGDSNAFPIAKRVTDSWGFCAESRIHSSCGDVFVDPIIPRGANSILLAAWRAASGFLARSRESFDPVGTPQEHWRFPQIQSAHREQEKYQLLTNEG